MPENEDTMPACTGATDPADQVLDTTDVDTSDDELEQEDPS